MKIPHSVVGRTQPTKERDRYLRVQTSADAFGASVGRALTGVGSALAGFGDQLEKRQEQTERFAALRNLSEFNAQVNEELTEAKRSAEPNGANFPAQWAARYRNMEDKFLADRVPPSLQEEFRFRTGQIGEGARNDALSFQFTQQDAFSRTGLGEEFTQAQIGLAKNPEELEHWETWISEAVDATVLSTIEKETLKRQYRQGLQAIAYQQEAYRRASEPAPVEEVAPDTGPHPPGSAPKAITYSKEELRGANAKVAGVLDAVSADLGKKFEIRSGHRTETSNKEAGGVDKSQHLKSNALDISTRGMSQEERGALIRSAVANGANGIGVYATAVHIDARSGPGVSRWGPSYGNETFPKWAGPYIEAGLEDRKAGRVGSAGNRSGAGGAGARTGGSRSWRNNNPGNIEAGGFAQRLGATGSDGRFAVFPDYETGRAAQEHLIFNTAGYKDLSIEDALARYAPSSENDTSAYVNQVAGAIGVPGNTRLADLTPEQRSVMLDAMQQVEGWEPGTLDDDPRFNLVPYEDRLALQRDAGVQARRDQAAERSAFNEAAAEDLNSLLVRINDGKAGQMDVDAWRARTPGARFADIERVQNLLEKKQGDVFWAQDGLAKIEAGGQWNPYDADDKKRLNAIGEQTKANQRLSDRDKDFVQRGLVPLAAQVQDFGTDQAEHLMAMTRSRDIDTMSFAFDTLSQLETVAMEAFNHRITDANVRSNVEFWRATKGYYTPEERQAIMAESRDPNVRRQRVELLQEGKELAREELEEEVVLREFSGFLGFGTPDLPSQPIPRRALMAEAREVFAEEYVKYGEVEGATAGTLKRLHRDWGVTERGGRRGLMKYPPERVYDPHEGGFDWVDEELWEGIGVEEGTRFELISDGQTREEFEHGEPPSYRVLYWDANEVPQVFEDDEGQPARFAFTQPVVSEEEQAAQLAYDDALAKYKELEHQLLLGEATEARHGTPVPEEFRREFEQAREALEALGGERGPEPVEPVPVGPRKRTLTEPWIPDDANR